MTAHSEVLEVRLFLGKEMAVLAPLFAKDVIWLARASSSPGG